MYISIFMIFFNLFCLYIFKSIKSGPNEYTKEKNKFYKLKLKNFLRIVNIGYIIIYLLYYLIIACFVRLDSVELISIYLILYALNIIEYLFVEYSTKMKNTRFKLIDKKTIDNKSIILVICFYILFIVEKVSYNYYLEGENIQARHDFIFNYNLFTRIIATFIIFSTLIYIIKLLLDNKEYCAYNYNKELYLSDAKFYNRIDIKKGFNHLVYLTAYIVFFYINIPFIYIFYILMVLLLIYLIKRKIKKIHNEGDKLYKTIALVNNKPGINYPFQFVRDLLLLKKMVIFTIILVFSTIIYYGLGESIFTYSAMIMYIYLLYTIICDKIYLIRYISSLNDKFIDKKKYSIIENKLISYIDIINIFNITLYRLIVVDTITYESNIIIYDPEYRIESIDIRINKSNINDYITIERELYEEE